MYEQFIAKCKRRAFPSLIYYNSKRSVVNTKNASLSAMINVPSCLLQKGIANTLEMLRDA